MSEIFLKSLRISYQKRESGAAKNAYQKALGVAVNGDWSAGSVTLVASVEISKNMLCFFLYSTVLSTLNIWMIILLIAMALLNCFWISRNLRYKESIREEEAGLERKFWYVKAAMGNTAAAKDIRIFGMQKWLTKTQDQNTEAMTSLQGRIQKQNARQEQLCHATAMLRDMAAYGYLIYQVSAGRLTAGEFMLYFGAITGFSIFVTGIVRNIGELKGASDTTNYYRAYMEQEEEELEDGEAQICDLEQPLSISFEDVTFSYDGKRNIFEHFSMKIHAGEKLALVGMNGVGKTTFVKLLCGLYEPDAGKITINGIDSRKFSKRELWQLFSVVFQEAFLLPFSLGENISMKRPEQIDAKRAWDALEKAGIRQIFEKKGATLETFLTHDILEGGITLSGGQQQRLLLARALYKDGAILILDEPTAALDPIAENEVYESYRKYTEQKTAVFISHRLASTRFSDRIVLLENGKILEEGTHDELMKRGGAYAQMYRVQSNYYQDTGEREQE